MTDRTYQIIEAGGNALGKVIWWWFWYGLVTEVLGNVWGFIIVLVIVFIYELFKKSKR